MTKKINFRPLKRAWVALHPQPIGVVQFLGGAFFGSFPTLFYRFLLRQLYNQGDTVVALPFRFTFSHWSVSIGLVKELFTLRGKMYAEAERLGYESAIYRENPCQTERNYFWLGHSLGNKYIALLELLSEWEQATPQAVLAKCIPPKDVHKVEQQLATVDLHEISLINQPSVLVAPEIEGIESAIPVAAEANIAKRFFDVQPTLDQNHCLICKSGLLGLLGLISFNQDDITQQTVDYIRSLPDRPTAYQALEGKHLAPLGFKSGYSDIVDTVLKFLWSLEILLPEKHGKNCPDQQRFLAPIALTL